MLRESMGILRREGEQGDKYTLGKYVKMVDMEVDEIFRPSTQAEFGLAEVGEF